MKYFTKELWRQLNAEEQEVREDAEKRWKENEIEYCNYIRGNRHIKIRKLRDNLLKYNLHDSSIYRMVWDSEKQKFVIETEYQGNELQIIFLRVKKVNLSLQDALAIPTGLRWGYYELFQESRQFITIDILFDFENELSITAEAVDIIWDMNTGDGTMCSDKTPE